MFQIKRERWIENSQSTKDLESNSKELMLDEDFEMCLFVHREENRLRERNKNEAQIKSFIVTTFIIHPQLLETSKMSLF